MVWAALVRAIGSVARLGRPAVARAGAGASRASKAAAFRRGPAGAGGAGNTATKSSWADRANTAGNLMYAGNQLLSGFQSVINAVTDDFTHIITVEVKGGPKANVKRIWQLAVSAAFGKYRQGVNGGGDLTISATWDTTGKAVAVQLQYTNKGFTSTAVNLVGAGGQRFSGYEEFLRAGPSQELIGGDWDLWTTFGKVPRVQVEDGIWKKLIRIWWNTVGPGAVNAMRQGEDPIVNNIINGAGVLIAEGPDRRIAAGAGKLEADFLDKLPLPDDGRVITTSAKQNPHVQPFQPNTDYLLALVSASLTDPCVLPVSPPTDAMAGQVKFRTGYRVYAAGKGKTAPLKVNTITDAVDLTPNIIPIGIPIIAVPGNGVGGARFNTGVDGYAQPTAAQNPAVGGAFNDPR